MSGTAAGSRSVGSVEAGDILASVGDALYLWDIESDALSWSANAGDVLLIRDPGTIASGRGYAQLVEKDSAQTRFDAVMRSDQHDGGRGVSYRIQYCIRPEPGSDQALWIEDTGRWFAGPDGKPVRAHGVVRAINERHESERRLNYLARYDSLTGERNRAHLIEVLEKTSRGRNSIPLFMRLPSDRDRQSGADQRVVWVRDRRPADRCSRQAHPQIDAGQRLAGPYFRQQIRHRVA